MQETSRESAKEEMLKTILQKFSPYFKSLVAISLVTALGLLIRAGFGSMNLDMFYLLIVVVIAIRWGRGPAIMTSILSVLVFNHFFIPPYFASWGFDLQSAFVLIGFLVISVVISELASRARQQAIEAIQREKQASLLLAQQQRIDEASRQIELLRETDKLQTALLNSISHDLRTPLVSIMGVLDSLLHDFSSLDQQTRKELLGMAYEDSDHLNRLVGNLLDMTRLEAKAMKIRIEPCELRDLIGVSLQSLRDEIEERNIVIHIPENISEVPVDFSLMMRVFINIVDNAVKYSQPNTTIEITAAEIENQIKIEIRDEGIGIPKEDLVKIFDKFYRAFHPRQITGTGLGLSICKGIVELHGGQILAQNNSDRGATISVILPLAQQTGIKDG